MNLLFKSYAHLICACETAELLKSDYLRGEVRRHGMRCLFSRCGNLCVLARAEKLEVVIDMTAPTHLISRMYNKEVDKQDLPCMKTTTYNPKLDVDYRETMEFCHGTEKGLLWYFIVDVTHGTDSNGLPIRRCGQVTTRVLVYHVDNKKAAMTPSMVRNHLVKMHIVAAYYRVDLICGDANAASYRYHKNQLVKNYQMGNMVASFKRVSTAYNRWLEKEKEAAGEDWDLRKWIETQCMNGHFCVNIPYTQKEYLDKLAEGTDVTTDCLMSMSLSWGHGDATFRERQQGAEGDRSVEMVAYSTKDFYLGVSTYAMTLTNEDLRLPEKDKDWHIFLQCTAREMCEKNLRKRSEGAMKRRKARKIEALNQKRPRSATGWEAAGVAAGLAAEGFTHASGESTMCPIATITKEEGTWANVAIAMLCLLGILAVLKMVSDLSRAYWNFCVQQAAATDGARASRDASAAREAAGKGDPSEEEGDAPAASTTKESSEGVRSSGPRSRPPSPPEQEPMYVPENGPSSSWPPFDKEVKNGLPQTIFLFRSGECYHTEQNCRYVLQNPLAPTRRRLCTCCEAITNRRIREQQGRT